MSQLTKEYNPSDGQSVEQNAIRDEQTALQASASAKKHASEAYEAMQSAWEECCSTKAQLDIECKKFLQPSDATHDDRKEKELAFRRAKIRFDGAKTRHELAEKQFNHYKEIYDHQIAEYDYMVASRIAIKEEPS